MENNKGLSMFGTDFASTGLSWAGNLYHKWENICWENIAFQGPSKFVDAVTEQFRKICEEVADDWLDPFSDSCVEGPVSDLSLEQDVIAKVCKKSKFGYDESSVNEGSVICLSEENASVAPLPVIGQDVSEEAHEIFHQKIVVAPSEDKKCSCASETKEDNEEVSSDFVHHPCPLSSAGIPLPEFPDSIAERGSWPSNFSIETRANGTSTLEEIISSIQSIANAYDQKSNPSEPDMAPSKPAGKNIEENEEFEDVKLEDLFEEKKQVDYWEDAKKDKLTLIRYRIMKNRSYMEKIRDVLNSSFYSPKKKSNSNAASSHGAIDVVPIKGDMTVSSVSSRGLESKELSAREPCEPDWELL